VREPTTIDFETEAIASRPNFPPKPVSVAIRYPGGKKRFLSWGHPDGNNCDVASARAELTAIYRDQTPKLFHNGAFDLDVGNVHLGLPVISHIEDSMFLAFLNDPHERTIALKPLSEKYLGMPPEEQSDLRDWILEHGRQPNGKKITKKKDWGAYISQAPVKLVKPYAIGDVDRTFKIWEHLRPKIVERGMHPAYLRELQLMPITLEMERSGIRVDLPRLHKADRVFAKLDAEIVKRIYSKLKIRAGDDFNVNSGPQLAKALKRAGKLTAIVRTPTGKMSTKIKVLNETCNDPQLMTLLAVHSVCVKYLNTFIRPWIAQAEQTGGRILPGFTQVKDRTDDGGGGTRTGRMASSDPNLQTVTKNVDESKNKLVLKVLQRWLRELYGYRFIGLRDFFIPDEGAYLISTDYNQQELRLLAHFENGDLAKAYRNNPTLDIHQFLTDEIQRLTGVSYERSAVKTLVFGILYGMGLQTLSDSIGESRQVAQQIKSALFRVLPGLQSLIDQLSRIADIKKALRTYGGREYFCEQPFTLIKGPQEGRTITFEYKLLNYLIQASAADVTKQGMIQVHQAVPQVRIALQVHDELICMASSKRYGPRIAAALCDQRFNVPMLADSKYSLETWARAA
jgi:DNA polymerase-1